MVYVPNGVDIAHFRLPEARRLGALRAALGLRGRRVVAYVGTLALQNHPVDLLLAAWPYVVAASPDALLLIVGGGEDLPTLQAWVAAQGLTQHVRFTGAVEHHAVPAMLALAEMSVDPVHDDAVARARSPLKLVESMALGVPVITGAVGDREALLAHGRAGHLVAPSSPTALATAMIALLQDEAQRLRLAAAGRTMAQGYAWERLAQEWLGVYGSEA